MGFFAPEQCVISFPTAPTVAKCFARPQEPTKKFTCAVSPTSTCGEKSFWEKESEAHLKTLYFPQPNLV